MQNSIAAFFAGLQGKKIFFIGMGVSHFEAIQQFKRKGLDVTVCDKRTEEKLAEAYPEHYAQLKALGITFVTTIRSIFAKRTLFSARQACTTTIRP